MHRYYMLAILILFLLGGSFLGFFPALPHTACAQIILATGCAVTYGSFSPYAGFYPSFYPSFSPYDSFAPYGSFAPVGSPTWSGTSGSQSTGGLVRSQRYTLYCSKGPTTTSDSVDVIVAPSFDFNLSASASNLTLSKGNSGLNTITATFVQGITRPVSFSISGLPTGASGTFAPTSCNPTCSTNLNISTSVSTPPGTYPITVYGSPF